MPLCHLFPWEKPTWGAQSGEKQPPAVGLGEGLLG